MRLIFVLFLAATAANAEQEPGLCGSFNAVRFSDRPTESRPFSVIADHASGIQLAGRFKEHPLRWPIYQAIPSANAESLATALRRGAKLIEAAAAERAKLIEPLWTANLERFSKYGSSANLWISASGDATPSLLLTLTTHEYLPQTNEIWSPGTKSETLRLSAMDAISFAAAIENRAPAALKAGRDEAENARRVERAKATADGRVSPPESRKKQPRSTVGSESRPKPKHAHRIATVDHKPTPIKRGPEAASAVLGFAPDGATLTVLAEREVGGIVGAYVEMEIDGKAISGWVRRSDVAPIR